MIKLHRHFPKNEVGTDYAVGDIHGRFPLLEDALAVMGFDKSKDRLFGVGDLVDRGPYSERFSDYLDFPWFFSVRGNHEQMLLERQSFLERLRHGAGWWEALPEQEKIELRLVIGQMPVMISVDVEGGRVGIVHGDMRYIPNWDKAALIIDDFFDRKMVNSIIWDRHRWEYPGSSEEISGVKALIVGHTPHDDVQYDANVINLDTGAGYDDGALTIMNLNTLEIAVTFSVQ